MTHRERAGTSALSYFEFLLITATPDIRIAPVFVRRWVRVGALAATWEYETSKEAAGTMGQVARFRINSEENCGGGKAVILASRIFSSHGSISALRTASRSSWASGTSFKPILAMETVCIESRLFSPPFHLRFRLDGTNYRHVSREPAQSQFQLAPGVYLYRRTAVEKRPPPPLAHPLFRGKLKEPRSRGLEIIDFNQPSSLAWPQKRNCAGEFGSWGG